LGAVFFLLLLSTIPLGLIWYLVAAEHDRRVSVLHEGGEGGCRLVSSHPVGRSLQVRFDPEDHDNSVAIGADLWPGWAVIPPLLGLPILILAGVVIYAVVRNSFRKNRPSR